MEALDFLGQFGAGIAASYVFMGFGGTRLRPGKAILGSLACNIGAQALYIYLLRSGPM